MISVPLEMTASMLLLLWWAWPPLVVCAWWWADRSWKWAWVLATEAGVFGAQWAFIGAYSLRDFPQSRFLVAALWTAFPAALAATSAFNHHRAAAVHHPSAAEPSLHARRRRQPRSPTTSP